MFASPSLARRPIFSLIFAAVLFFVAVVGSAYCAPLAYVTNLDDGTVSVIDTASNTVVATVPVGIQPYDVAVSPLGDLAFIANKGPDTISVIDTATNTVVRTIAMSSYGSSINGLLVNGTATRLYVTLEPNSVAVVDLSTFNVVATIPVVYLPIGLVFSPDETRLYVANWCFDCSGNGSVTVIDTSANSVLATIPTNYKTPRGIAVHPNGAFVYLTNEFGNRVSVFDTAANTIVDDLPVGTGQLMGITVSPTGDFAYVAGRGSDLVYVIDTATRAVVETIPVGPGPYGLSLNPAGSRLYATNVNGTTVSVIDTMSRTVIDAVTVGRRPVAFGQFVGPDNARANVSITGTASADQVMLGQQLTYTLHVENAGPDMATGVVVSDILPSAVDLISVAGTPCSTKNSQIVCLLGILDAGASKDISIVVVPTAVGTVLNHAGVAGNDVDPDTENNTTDVEVVVSDELSTDLSLVKVDSPDPVTVGKALHYALTVKNIGPASAPDVVVTDTLPTGFVFGSVSSTQGNCAHNGSSVTCSLGTLGNGAVATMTLVVTPTVIGTYTNTASVTSSVLDSDLSNNTALSVTAVVPKSVSLAVLVLGGGTVRSTPSGILCPRDCEHDYPKATSVALSATPAERWQFGFWLGACWGTRSCEVNMGGNRAVVAVFLPKRWFSSQPLPNNDWDTIGEIHGSSTR